MSDCKPSGPLGCQQVVDYSIDFIDGALPATEQQHFREHLDACPECVRFFETYKQTPAVSRDCLAGKMPDTVKASVLSFLRDRCK